MTATSNSYDRVDINSTDRPSPHVDGKFDPNNEWTKVRSSIQVHAPCHSQVLTKLSIHIPDRFKPQTAKIQITDSAEPTLLFSSRGFANERLRQREASPTRRFANETLRERERDLAKLMICTRLNAKQTIQAQALDI